MAPVNVVVVTGSRYGHVWVGPTLGLLHKHGASPLTHLVLGDCPTGVDPKALEWAIDNNVFFVVLTADWDGPLGLGAGPDRNKRMVRLAEKLSQDARVLGFPCPKSKGTWQCMNFAARASGLRVFRVKNNGRLEKFG